MLTIESARNPVWSDKQNTGISLIVKFNELEDEIPFNATPNDPMPYGVELYNNAIDGLYGVIAPYVDPVI